MSNKNQELEGFICPICYVDLGSLLNLRGHFETCHPDEDTAIVDQIKGVPKTVLKLPSNYILNFFKKNN